jgi:flagellar biosynthetic protein FliR
MNFSLVLPYAFSFLEAASRMAALVAMLPLPYLRSAPVPVKLGFGVLLALLLVPAWPRPVAAEMTLENAAARSLLGAASSVVTACAAGLAMDLFVAASRLIGLNAGFGYASTIDPSTQADSGVLDVVGGLFAALLAVTAGLDRPILLAMARSASELSLPAAATAPAMVSLLAQTWSSAFRLALPVLALLLLIDLVLALGAKVQAQLQLISLSFPVKMLLSFLLLAASAQVWPPMLERAFELAVRIVTAD